MKKNLPDSEYSINFMPILPYLPLNEYNPLSIMHYDWQFLQPKNEKLKQYQNQELPSEPDEKDWENLNHFYGSMTFGHQRQLGTTTIGHRDIWAPRLLGTKCQK